MVNRANNINRRSARAAPPAGPPPPAPVLFPHIRFSSYRCRLKHSLASAEGATVEAAEAPSFFLFLSAYRFLCFSLIKHSLASAEGATVEAAEAPSFFLFLSAYRFLCFSLTKRRFSSAVTTPGRGRTTRTPADRKNK